MSSEGNSEIKYREIKWGFLYIILSIIFLRYSARFSGSAMGGPFDPSNNSQHYKSSEKMSTGIEAEINRKYRSVKVEKNIWGIVIETNSSKAQGPNIWHSRIVRLPQCFRNSKKVQFREVI